MVTTFFLYIQQSNKQKKKQIYLPTMPSSSPYLFIQQHKAMVVAIFTVAVLLNISAVVWLYKEQKRSPTNLDVQSNFRQSAMLLVAIIILGPSFYAVAYVAEKHDQKIRDKYKKDHPKDSVAASSSSFGKKPSALDIAIALFGSPGAQYV